MSVHNFLERVTELCESRHVSKQQVFESAVDLFAGKALTWYRANKLRVHDWNSLTNLLRVHFEPLDYRSRLFKEILERTQDTSKSIVEYLSCIQALFRRYGGLSETAQLDILERNLSPFYATQLPVIASICQLEEECLKLEIKKYRSDNYVPPSRRKNQFVEPDFAFVGAETTLHHVTSLRPETSLFASECTPSASNHIRPLPSNVNTVKTSQNFSRSVTVGIVTAQVIVPGIVVNLEIGIAFAVVHPELPCITVRIVLIKTRETDRGEIIRSPDLLNIRYWSDHFTFS